MARKRKQSEQLFDTDKPWGISDHRRRLGRYWFPIWRRQLGIRRNYIRHEDYDNHEIALFGPVPNDADLNDAASDLWAQSGEVEVISEEQMREEFDDPFINSWDVWLSQAG